MMKQVELQILFLDKLGLVVPCILVPKIHHWDKQIHGFASKIQEHLPGEKN